VAKTYNSPPAFRTALNQAARRISKDTGMSVGELQRIFYFNRLSARVFTHDPQGWLIKGGQALLVRYQGAARLSGDIDLQAASPDLTPEHARHRLLDAAALDLKDFLRYAPTKYTTSSDEERGGSQSFQVYLGTTHVDTVKVDIAVSRSLTGAPETRSLKPAIDVPWPVDWPEVRLYPVVDHLTDKICALYERHGQDASNRYRDLADLLLMSQQEFVRGQDTCRALRNEAERRRSVGIDLTLPERFEPPGPQWEANYPAAAALVLGLEGCRTFLEASEAASVFLNPLLDGTASGTWNPSQAAWQ